MAKQQGRRRGAKRSPVGDPGDPHGMAAALYGFTEWQRTKGYSERTIENRTRHMTTFILWCEERGIVRPVEVTRPVLERYQRWLYHYRKKDGEPLSFRSQHQRLTCLRAFFRYLTRHNLILYNPASELELPKLERRLPKHVLTAAEAEKVLNQADIRQPLGIRDRAILETLYSTGMRRSEVVGLKLYDLDSDRGTIMVRQGKGKKDRMIPIGERAIAWVTKYVRDVRPDLVADPTDTALFLTALGEPFTPNRLTRVVREYVVAAELGKEGACHIFRHTMATLMLEHGADIRFIQAMLGHAELSTTQIYTQVSIRQLKEIHTRTHPAALNRRRDGAELDGDARAELVSLLAAETGDDEESDDAGDEAPKP
jgi:integrase/recombinase XerD